MSGNIRHSAPADIEKILRTAAKIPGPPPGRNCRPRAFRALAYLDGGRCRFVSRRGNEIKRFNDLSGGERGGRGGSPRSVECEKLIWFVYFLSGVFCSPSKPTFLSSVSARLLGTEPLLTSDLVFLSGV